MHESPISSEDPLPTEKKKNIHKVGANQFLRMIREDELSSIPSLHIGAFPIIHCFAPLKSHPFRRRLIFIKSIILWFI